MRHPMQPIQKDKHGRYRFKENKIISFLANGKLNDISGMDFTDEDREQLAQLIGYSLSGFAELSYVSDETYETAAKMAEDGTTEVEARIKYLEDTLKAVKEGMKKVVTTLFKIHPEDLED